MKNIFDFKRWFTWGNDMEIDTTMLQHEIMANKAAHNWNTTDVRFELLQLYSETSEPFEATLKKDQANIAEELADVAIFLLGIAEMEHVDLGEAIIAKLKIDQHRVYDEQGHKRLLPDKSTKKN
ncbi:hypothetical protein FD35_GL000317 [Furfurilactobacillus rossiae DSM 15814]|uniref:NTP pyrophosphohydrolase MazG-like domain-containing protein n=2 Tax=Furfurilactobacillus rossiae TaxID=231049 RepID=A0A0R1RWA9_9LACO|nr:hypothetical protein FD35_GL000317 [Furfurilactobacillus rossiae DSM 15814]